MAENEQQYLISILFDGELSAGIRREQALVHLSQLTNLPVEELLDALFSVRPVIINQLEDVSLATTYIDAFSEAGLVVKMVPWCKEHDDIINVAVSFGHFAPIERGEETANYEIDTAELEQKQTTEGSKPDNDTGARWCVTFNGETQPGIERSQVINNIGYLTRATEQEILEALFSVVPVTVFQHQDEIVANQYYHGFSEAGLVLEFEYKDNLKHEMAVSDLTIRDDAPAPKTIKSVSPFVYSLAGLAILAFFSWLLINNFYAGIFNQQQDVGKTYSVKLNYAKIPLPFTPQGRTDKTNLPPEELPEPVINESAIEPIPRKQIGATAKVKQNELASQATSDSVALAKAKDNYFFKLLNWFAQPQHQGYDEATRSLNLEGEIAIKITIARDGRLVRTKVLESSSKALRNVTTDTAKRASPYPAVPKAITGMEYSFTLPLKYTLED